MTWADEHWDSPRDRIYSRWRVDHRRLTHAAMVSANTHALLYLPTSSRHPNGSIQDDHGIDLSALARDSDLSPQVRNLPVHTRGMIVGLMVTGH